MPILYPVAAVNFFIIYWVYKLLLIKYYKKTTAFNQDLPIYSIFYLRIGIFIHILMATFILSNEQIVTTKLFDRIAEAQGTTDLVEDNAHKISEKDESGHLYTFLERLTTGVGHFYVEFMLLILFFYVAGSTIGKMLKCIWRAIKGFLLKIKLCQSILKSEEQLEKEK